MKTCIVIPAYNEARTIGEVIKRIRNLNLDLIIVDDGSLDNTSEVAKIAGATVIKNTSNEGKGSSLIKGFSYALKNNFDAVISMDADGQHHADDISNFIDLAKKSDSGILIGNRMQETKDMPWLRIQTNKTMSWFISLLTRQKIYDSQCGFRLIKREVLEKIKLNTNKYETESEMLVKAARLGFKIESVPIRTIYAEETSQINPFIDTLRFFRFLIKEVWTTKS
ncbi:MAG: glycosyltransferase family 2 protein [Candidatus Omnitrophica bacterium]|nr:glycosyltransferase family 2 protein [Candidatus Omnitrophota bacterium]